MSTEAARDEVIERLELSHIAGKMLGAIEYLRATCSVRAAEGASYARLSDKLADLTWARDRIVALADSLPEGPLEAFAREHPLHHDPIDGPYCGYGAAEGKPYSCPVRDQALHWDAWELMGTHYRRPVMAKRGNR